MVVSPTRSANDENLVEFKIKNINISFEPLEGEVPMPVSLGYEESNVTTLGGEVALSGTTVKVDETVTITPTAFYGFELSSIEVKKADGTNVPTTESDGNYTFTGESDSVNYTVTPTFTVKDSVKIVYLKDATVTGGTGRNAGIAMDNCVQLMNYTTSGANATWAAQDLKKDAKNPTSIVIVATKQSDPSATIEVAGQAAATASLLGFEGAEFRAANKAFSVSNIALEDVTYTDSDVLKLTLTNSTPGSGNFIGNYWYLVLDYTEPTA